MAVAVSAQERCLVVVLREPEHSGQRHHLVVGADGSGSSRTAMVFAVKEAALRGAVQVEITSDVLRGRFDGGTGSRFGRRPHDEAGVGAPWPAAPGGVPDDHHHLGEQGTLRARVDPAHEADASCWVLTAPHAYTRLAVVRQRNAESHQPWLDRILAAFSAVIR